SSATALGAALIDGTNPMTAPETTGNFFGDILNDQQAYVFHRFQMFSWTLILGMVYMASVLQEVGPPTFDDTLLVLMGISSGVYIGFKMSGNSKDPGEMNCGLQADLAGSCVCDGDVSLRSLI